MRATFMYGAGDVRVENVPDPALQEPTNALGTGRPGEHLRQRPAPVSRYAGVGAGPPMGHEFLGVVEELGAEVSDFRRGDLVVAPFAISDNTNRPAIVVAVAGDDPPRASRLIGS